MIRKDFVVSNAGNKRVSQLSREINALSGLPLTKMSEFYNEIAKCGLYVIKDENDEVVYISKTSESFARRVNENLANFDRFSTLLNKVKDSNGIRGNNGTRDFIYNNYKLITIPFHIYRGTAHRKLVGLPTIEAIEVCLIGKFQPRLNIKHNPIYAE